MRNLLTGAAMAAVLTCSAFAFAGGVTPPPEQGYVLMVVFIGNAQTGNQVYFAPGVYSTQAKCLAAAEQIRNHFMNSNENVFNRFHTPCINAADEQNNQ